MIRFLLVLNRQGKVHIARHYAPLGAGDAAKLAMEVHQLVASRDQRSQSNFVEFRSGKIVYRRYAGLYFCMGIDMGDSELVYLEAMHLCVEVLDRYFGNVNELDLVFHFYKVYALLDEMFLAGEIEETSKDTIIARMAQLERLG